MSLSLYVHIPFCLKRCIYCDFVSGIYDPDKAAGYIEALKKEISIISEKVNSKIPPNPPLPKWGMFETLYIGGGTPTALSISLLKDFIDYIFTTLDFTEDCEATIEANPGTLDMEKLKVLNGAGMNRISIGVQSFNDDELKLLGRLHTSAEAEKAFFLAREAGFKNISIDLIYGIPGQSIKSWKETVEKAVGLKPEHISTYELTVEEGTSLSGSIKRGELSTLDEDLIEEMYYHTIDHLISSGYEQYEISNFAKPGFSSRHNLNYWQRGEYYGTGLGAHSFINGKRQVNTGELNKYISLLSDNDSPSVEKETITDEKALAEAIFLGLRKTGGINLKLFNKRYNLDILSRYQKEIKELSNAGLIEVAGSNMRLTRRGLLLSNEVFVKFV